VQQKSNHKAKGSAELINRLNKIEVLNIIRHEQLISRAEIVKKSGLSAPTVTRIVDSLINHEALAEQVGIGESSGGRPPVMVRFNAKNNFVIGIDWGRTHLHVVLANLDAEIVTSFDEPIPFHADFEHDLQWVILVVNKLLSGSNIPNERILGIGVAAAGYVNFHAGLVEFSPNFGWSKLNLKESIAQYFLFPVVVDNVSRVMALGELSYGVGAKIRNFIFVNIGFGIGSGIIIDGKPLFGFDGYSGEIGHSRVPNTTAGALSRLCVCGKANCLECFASGRGIAQTAKEKAALNPDSVVMQLANGDIEQITSELLAKAANLGDVLAKEIFLEAATLLGIALANFANAFNPEAVIIGGKVTLAGDFFTERINNVFQSEILPNVTRPVQLLLSDMQGSEAVKGAVALVLKEVLALNITNS
jgi:predicted NBD/HSP70 family sugar kinase